jgi:hypothetical protein
MEKKITITYRWWREDGEIQDDHMQYLEDRGEEHAVDMMQSGFLGGELNEEIDGIEYKGWFEIESQMT